MSRPPRTAGGVRRAGRRRCRLGYDQPLTVTSISSCRSQPPGARTNADPHRHKPRSSRDGGRFKLCWDLSMALSACASGRIDASGDVVHPRPTSLQLATSPNRSMRAFSNPGCWAALSTVRTTASRNANDRWLRCCGRRRARRWFRTRRRRVEVRVFGAFLFRRVHMLCNVDKHQFRIAK